MMIVNRNAKPRETIYYVSACVLKEIKVEHKIGNIELLYEKTKSKYKLNIKYNTFIHSLDFLFLINKIDFLGGEINYVN
ncbi:MAG: hypothetical protein PHG18_02355 [Bacilli bacterium]|nr:hypothetical protein [Bacilli bacterium]